MEEMASLWSYQDGVDEMRQKLQYAALEFERFKAATIEESRNKNEYICHLTQLLKNVSQERDEARGQLQKLINKVWLSENPSEFISNFPFVQNESPVILKPTNAGNPSITESTCLSEPVVNYNSNGSSLFDSFFDVVSAPDLSNINMAAPNNITNNNVGYLPSQPMLMQDSNLNVSMEMPKVDHATLIIDNLIKGKPLPEKGKLFQAVCDVPQLHQSVFLAGPLPKWCNPPWLHTSQIPNSSMQKDADVLQQNPMTNLSWGGPLNSHHYVQISCGSSQMATPPVYNFSPTGSCLGATSVGSAGENLNNFFSIPKRQRFQ